MYTFMYFYQLVKKLCCKIEMAKRDVKSPLRAVERVTLLRFLFGMHPYKPALDFAFFILE